MQGWRGGIKMVQVAHQIGYPRMGRLCRCTPVQISVMCPFFGLGKFTPHEQQLLAGMGPHVAVIGSQVRKCLCPLARHLFDHRSFAMHNLVVADRQDEILRILPHQRSCQVVLVILAMHRLALDVGQRIVHPAHVPFEPKPKTAPVHRLRHTRKRRTFLGNCHHIRVRAVNRDVHVL